MSNTTNSSHPFEPGLDELPPKPDHHFQLDRRKFFKLFGGGLAVAIVLKDLVSFAEDSAPPEATLVPTSQVGAWIHVGEDGTVSVYTGKVEVGQNIRTSLSQIVAEELLVPVSSIKMIMGDTDLVPYDAGTFGSRSTPQMGTQLRRAAATARQSFIEMAAKNWNVDVTNVKAENGAVINTRNNSKLSYAELTKGQQILLPISNDIKVIAASDWKVAGKTVNKINGRSFISGRHKYVSDMKLPGMLYGKILRPPSYQAKLIDADISKAQAMPGVVVVRDGSFIGVTANSLRTAEKALAAITAKWEEVPGQPSTSSVFDYLVKNASDGGVAEMQAPIKAT